LFGTVWWREGLYCGGSISFVNFDSVALAVGFVVFASDAAGHGGKIVFGAHFVVLLVLLFGGFFVPSFSAQMMSLYGN